MAVELWFPVPVMAIDVDPAVREATRTKVLAYLDSERGKRDVPPSPAESVSTSHDGSYLSASYYVEAPANCGQLVFPDPIPARRAHRAFTKTQGGAYFLMPEVGFTPKAGKLVMFESWVEHYVGCNKSDQPRISLAFNLRRAR